MVHVDAAYVIGLPRLGRLDRFFAEFPADWPIPKPQLIHGIDATRVPIPLWWDDLPGMYGCNEAHRAAIGRGLSDGHECIAIFEDDCRIIPDTGEMLTEFLYQIPDDWHGAMLGGQVSAFDGKTIPITSRVSKCVQVERNHAYLLNRKGMEAFYRVLCEPHGKPIDHRWGDMQEAGLVNVYRIEPFIAYQADGLSMITGRVEAARVWDDRVNVLLRRPEDVPIISLVCPFAVMEQLRHKAIIVNGGESPTFACNVTPERAEKGERIIADLMLHSSLRQPEVFRRAVLQLRFDAAFHRSALLALWHPAKIIRFDDAPCVEANNYEQALTAIQALAVVA